MTIRRAAGALLAAVLAASVLALPAPADAQVGVPHVLVFSGTFGFRHTSITKGNQVLQELAASTGAFTVEVTENPLDLSASKLATADILLINSSTGRFPITGAQRLEVERFFGCGGGFIGVHAAADANYGWPEYAELVGAQFDAHPHGAGAGEVSLIVENSSHPVNAAYSGMETWLHEDELYLWQRDVRGTQDVIPLLSLDETTSDAGDDYWHHQPLSWVKSFRGGGRVYYNNLGHNEATWDRPEFRESMVDGIAWVAEQGLQPDCIDRPLRVLPGPAAPPAPDLSEPFEPCVLAEGEERLTPEGVSTDVAEPGPLPVYFGKTKLRYVLDLSGTPSRTADVAIDLDWTVRGEDYDLAVTTPWGFAGSDYAQPAYRPYEATSLHAVPHCTPLLVDVYDHAGVTGEGLHLTIGVNKANTPRPAGAAPGAPGRIVAVLGSQTAGFLTTEAVITQGGTLSLDNLDTTDHNVACVERDPVTRKPICASPFARALTPAVDVAGVSALPRGTYNLYCQLHPYDMQAVLTIVDPP